MKDYEMAQVMAIYLNSFSHKDEEFIKQMGREHRTLQQSFTRLCVEWFKYLAEQKYYDARNEASVMLARKLKDQLDNLPLV